MKQKKFISVYVLLAALCMPLFPLSVASAAEDINALQDKEDKTEDQLNNAEKDVNKLESELGTITQSLRTTQQHIQSTSQLIDQTKTEISRKEQEIMRLEQRLTLNRKILESLVRELYYTGQEPLIVAVASHESASRLFGPADDLRTLKSRVNALIADVAASRDQIATEKSTVEKTKQEYDRLLALHTDQQKTLSSEKREVQSDIAEKEATIEELNAKLAEIRKDISSLLGESVNAGDIVEAAELASKKTGVRKNFILGMLVVESDLGRYTGGCTYDKTNMSKNREKIFKQIADELGYKYKKLKLSCPPKSYKGSGGAMGVAQFMPDTWMGYKSRIASATGHNPPDPWSLTDGVMAMAIKLSVVPGVTSQQKSGERNAAKLYLSGTTSSKYDWYADRVLYWAKHYKEKL
ncbi:MAG TPA: lytic murein transglycosylase [Patescibacteria group bacterium]|nr:lytic murein transglycosylase [Patescibacteria group bacterium]